MNHQENFQTLSSIETIETRKAIVRHYGAVIPIKYHANGEPKYVLGPHYCVFLSTVLITSILFSILGYSIASNAKSHNIEIALSIMASMMFYIYSYFKIGLSNPGLASSTAEVPQQDQKEHRFCHPCRIVRPIGTVHCYTCDICIHGYDHHCPWIGKCVGRENIGDFKQFLFSIMLALIVFAVSVYVSEESRKVGKN